MLSCYYADTFELPLPDGHRFPMSKYRRLRERIVASEVGGDVGLKLPPAATDDELARAHTRDYLGRVAEGRLDAKEVRRIGFPWSPQMVERSRRSSGATIAAAGDALDEGVAASLAGGTHHAFADRGEGFCVFNDSVVAARCLQARGLGRVLVIDCDVHQGNGTAALCRDDDGIFTLSIHGEKNYPYVKQTSDLDVALPDGTGDDEYLAALDRALEQAFENGPFELALYVSGADPWEGDRWGRLGLTKDGLAQRDARVLGACADSKLPVVVTMAGGYAPDVDDIVDIHEATIRTAANHRKTWGSR